MKNYKCCICHERFFGFGNNPYPVCKKNNVRCCDICNQEFVVPERIKIVFSHNPIEAYMNDKTPISKLNKAFEYGKKKAKSK